MNAGFLAADNRAVMGAKDASAIACAGDTVYITAKTICAGGIHLSHSEIKGAEGGILDIGGAIKICGCSVSSGKKKDFSDIDRFNTEEHQDIDIENI